MPTHDDELESEEPGGEKLTREEMRDEAAAYSRLAEELAKGSPAELPNPPFVGALRDAVLDARRFAKSAKQRQIRRLAQLLRQEGSVEEIRAALEGRTPALIAERNRERLNENWRARLLSEGDSALAELIAQHPQADRSRLRQLMRQASKMPADVRSKKASTTLIREIRQLRAASAPDHEG
jgi:ribosome-associated protein